MQFTHANQFDLSQANTVMLTLSADKVLTPSLEQADTQMNGAISQAITNGDLTGELGNQQLFLGNSPQRILITGSGKTNELSAKSYRKLVSDAWNLVQSNAGNRVACQLCLCASETLSEQDQVRLLLETIHQCNYRFDQFMSGDKEDKLAECTLTVIAPNSQDQFATSLATASAMDMCRDLGNMPGNVCTPTFLAKQAQQLAATSDKVSATVLDEAEMADLGMHCLLSVGKGSSEPSKLIVLEYQGAAKDEAPHVLVGKGITFDTGGISLKPGASMDEMKYDMCGAASVMSTMQAVIDLALPINVVMIIASAENMPAGNASKPGDIVTTMSGQTVEILNTDAEGRLVLCDALTYAERYNPATVVDVATLTGACIIALGHQTTAVLSNNDALASSMVDAGTQAFDATWQLPIGEEYQEQLKSNFADMANIGGRAAGTITAACFLARFTKAYAWAHLDIAGTAWTGGSNKGATGRCVPLLVQHLINRI